MNPKTRCMDGYDAAIRAIELMRWMPSLSGIVYGMTVRQVDIISCLADLHSFYLPNAVKGFGVLICTES